MPWGMDIWECRCMQQQGDPTRVEGRVEKVYILKYGMVPGAVSVCTASFSFCSTQVTD